MLGNDRILQLFSKFMDSATATVDPLLHSTHVVRDDAKVTRDWVVAKGVKVVEPRCVDDLVLAIWPARNISECRKSVHIARTWRHVLPGCPLPAR